MLVVSGVEVEEGWSYLDDEALRMMVFDVEVEGSLLSNVPPSPNKIELKLLQVRVPSSGALRYFHTCDAFTEDFDIPLLVS